MNFWLSYVTNKQDYYNKIVTKNCKADFYILNILLTKEPHVVFNSDINETLYMVHINYIKR